MTDDTQVIVNPVAGSSRSRRRSIRLAHTLSASGSAANLAWTRRPGHATDLARSAIERNASRIVVIGGDGTLNEVVNGFFGDDGQISSNAVLVPMGGGTGGDFRRTLSEMPTAHLRPVPMDVIRVTYTPEDEATADGPAPDPARPREATRDGATSGQATSDQATSDGLTATRYALNIVSTGLGGIVVRDVKTMLRVIPRGPLAYFAAIVRSLLRYSHDDVQISADGRDLGIHRIRNIAVANGRYFGGGLKIAPCANINDGTLDLVLLDNVPFSRLLRDIRAIYSGNHSHLPYLRHVRARTVTLRPRSGRPVYLDIDGESVGQLPATLEVIPAAVRITASMPHDAG